MKADDILPDGQDQLISNGVLVRKGTVAAFLFNARVWCESKAGSTERAVAETDIVEALPALQTMGLFDVLAVRDEALEQMIKRQKGT